VDDTLDIDDKRTEGHVVNIGLDLVAFGFWQVRVRQEVIHKTTFHTPYGMMEQWVVLAFGMCNSPTIFPHVPPAGCSLVAATPHVGTWSSSLLLIKYSFSVVVNRPQLGSIVHPQAIVGEALFDVAGVPGRRGDQGVHEVVICLSR
jgi:hypothetical protein